MTTSNRDFHSTAPRCEIELVKAVQKKISAILFSSKFLDAGEERQAIKECLAVLNSQTNEILLFSQLIVKVRDELVAAKLDRERILKLSADKQGSNTQRRVQWLEEKLYNISLTYHEKCFELERQLSYEINKIAEYNLLSDRVIGLLHETTKTSLFKSCDCSYTKNTKETKALQDMQKNLSKMKLSHPAKTFSKKPSSTILLANDKCIQSDSFFSAKLSPNVGLIDDKDCLKPNYRQVEKSNFQQQRLAPMSWHKFALSADAGNTLKKQDTSHRDIPKVLSIVEHQNAALEQLAIKLQTIYDQIEDIAMLPVEKRKSPRIGNSPQIRSPQNRSTKNRSPKNRSSSQRQRNVSLNRNSPGNEKHDVKLAQLKLPDVSQDGSLPTTPTKIPYLLHTEQDHEIVEDVFPLILSIPSKTDEISHSRQVYPRSPALWCDKKVPIENVTLHQFQNTYSDDSINLPTEGKNTTTRTSQEVRKRAMKRIKLMHRLKDVAQPDDRWGFEELKENKVLDIVSSLQNENMNIAIDAAKSAAQLKNKDKRIVNCLENIVVHKKRDVFTYHCSKALLSLEAVNNDVVDVLVYCLRNGSETLRLDILESIQNAFRIPNLYSKNVVDFSRLSAELLSMLSWEEQQKQCLRDDNDRRFLLFFGAAISLAYLGVIAEEGKEFLLTVLIRKCSYEKKNLALIVLVKLMRCHDNLVIESLLNLIQHSSCWKQRLQCAGLLQIIGIKRMEVYGLDKLFPILQQLLWDHPNKEFRKKIAHLMEYFGMKNAACADVLRKLENKSEMTRVEAIISLAMLSMKGDKEMKMLLDILELDSSVYVRTHVIRAFVALRWNHPRVNRALQKAKKSAIHTLSIEAVKAIQRLKAA